MHEKGFTESDVDASSYLLDVLMAISHYLCMHILYFWCHTRTKLGQLIIMNLQVVLMGVCIMYYLNELSSKQMSLLLACCSVS